MKINVTNILIGLVMGIVLTTSYFQLTKIRDSTKKLSVPSNELMRKASDFIRNNITINPIEFSCSDTSCNIPQTSLGWSGLDPSNSTCVWTKIGGNAAIPSHEVTENGMHIIKNDQTIDSVLCQNFDGKIFWGDSKTKIIPDTK